MSSIQATENDTSLLLEILEKISTRQLTICKQLDELLLLMQMPSENVLEVLERLLLPMAKDMGSLNSSLIRVIEAK